MSEEVARFAFGRNWQRFRTVIDKERIDFAAQSFAAFIGEIRPGETMLDVGCGSGMSSLVARRLGFRVRAFDYDPDAVVCAQALRQRFAPGDSDWFIESGDALSESYMASLGKFDLVYSWGVLHHTGDMWRAIENACSCVASKGRLAIAIYNDQGGASRRWRRTKRLYNRLPRFLQPPLVALCTGLQCWKDVVVGSLRGRPFQFWRDYSRDRGMSLWHDMVDWVGGYPFEVAKPEEVFEFVRDRGFTLQRVKTCGGGNGCNEYLFSRDA